MKKLVWIVGLSWLPYSLNRIHLLGYDFPYYYNKITTGYEKEWYYSQWVSWILSPLSFLSLDAAFVIFYLLSIWCWATFWDHTKDTILGVALFILSFYPMLLCLELGQITPILIWLSLSSMGSVIAFGVKPYYGVFVLLHLTTYLRKFNNHQSIHKAKSITCSSVIHNHRKD